MAGKYMNSKDIKIFLNQTNILVNEWISESMNE